MSRFFFFDTCFYFQNTWRVWTTSCSSNAGTTPLLSRWPHQGKKGSALYYSKSIDAVCSCSHKHLWGLFSYWDAPPHTHTHIHNREQCTIDSCTYCYVLLYYGSMLIPTNNCHKIINVCIDSVWGCLTVLCCVQLCQAKGFICEFCHGEEVIFPFQRDTCTRCQGQTSAQAYYQHVQHTLLIIITLIRSWDMWKQWFCPPRVIVLNHLVVSVKMRTQWE